MSNLAIAILAAGASSRMGKPKQQLLFRGKSLVQHAVDIAIETGCSSIYLVVNPEHRVLNDKFAYSVNLLVNASFAEGLSTSIRLATATVSAMTEIDGLLFLNCDQPYLTSAELLRLIGHYEDGKIVASSFSGTIGSPAIFDRVFFNDLLQLKGDVGAKHIIKQNREHLVICEMSDAEFDIDTPDDYKALLAASEKAAT
jgi:molybdenum cofactor cytidylyltransferase